jgi:hypothetical protein
MGTGGNSTINSNGSISSHGSSSSSSNNNINTNSGGGRGPGGLLSVQELQLLMTQNGGIIPTNVLNSLVQNLSKGSAAANAGATTTTAASSPSTSISSSAAAAVLPPALPQRFVPQPPPAHGPLAQATKGPKN